jgi:phosphatidylserine/phosphatidylglycerophosphate/cardiolipin synthase-like enzyme
MSVLHQLARPALISIARALESPTITPPFSLALLGVHVPEELAEQVQHELTALADDGMQARHIANLLRLMASERRAAQEIADRVELVWSGLGRKGQTSRDTSVVVSQLFAEARHSILIASYAVDRGKKAEALFGALADRMDQEPDLQVRLFLNVQPKSHRDETPDAMILREFADTFRSQIWPGERLPEVYHDPRSLAVGGTTRACLHAKCIVVDDERALLTSANFTEAAHERNIEAGVVITDTSIARALKAQFDILVEQGELRLVPGIG